MNKIILTKRAKKDIKNLQHLKVIIKKCEECVEELKHSSTGGDVYKRQGERLTDVEKEYKVDFEIHAIKLNDKLRFVYEVEKDSTDITITDVNNHLYRGVSYLKKKRKGLSNVSSDYCYGETICFSTHFNDINNFRDFSNRFVYKSYIKPIQKSIYGDRKFSNTFNNYLTSEVIDSAYNLRGLPERNKSLLLTQLIKNLCE